MRILLRLTAAGLVGAALLPASAAAAPALVVKTARLAGTTGPATIATREGTGTYRTTVFAPSAYRLARTGAQLGTATAASGSIRFHGFVNVADPAAYALDQCAAFSARHIAVWSVSLRQVDGFARIEIPVYLDAGPAGTTELTWCASAAADMAITALSLHLDRAFVAPAVAGRYAWRAQFDNAALFGRSALGAVTTSATAVVRVRSRR